jgi:acetylornithine/succinyldiaminopimelate/putrescine aminotransferase
MRADIGAIRTTGLDDATLLRLAPAHPDLVAAVDAAHRLHAQLRTQDPALLALDEDAQVAAAQEGLVNFYPGDAVNPYVALAARGPWIVTLKGAVIHDSGGYGMLGFGHTPGPVLEALAQPQAMANVMTPNLGQRRLTTRLREEIGHRNGQSPYGHFFCLNSGSESVTLACRIADVLARQLTDPGGPHAGRTIKRLAVKGAFHGRTEGPAYFSDSSRAGYLRHLASYRDEDSLITVDPYDVDQLQAVFATAEREGWCIPAMFLEPVMGEGDPGRALTRAFYDAARRLTRAHGGLLLVDSIQAGLRAHGVLSFVDYPDMAGIDPPDMETFSKALNAGQYPLSVLAAGDRASSLYKPGVYGNTMTSNPRATDVACAVLDMLTPQIRGNIRDRGQEFLDKLLRLHAELPELVTGVQGTGLLFSCELAPSFLCYGAGSTEEWLRERGIGVIHGGTNSLRFTPHFAITSEEVDLVVDAVRSAVLEGPRRD